jgi:hypothetical protein
MRRFSVRSLMVLIVGAAVGLAALRNANFFWASATVTVVVVAVATSVIGALTLRGRERYACAGFAVFSGVYLAVAVGIVLPERFKAYFGPIVALEYVRSKVSSDQYDPRLRQFVSGYEKQHVSLQQTLMAVQQKLVAHQQQPNQDLVRQQARLHAMLQELDARFQKAESSLNSADRWRSWLPGSVNTNEFGCVGHSLFALLSGLLGTVVARILCARRNRSETQTA